jgi:hypothetical protein
MLLDLVTFIDPLATGAPPIDVADHEALIVDITFQLSAKSNTDTFDGGHQPPLALDAMSNTKTETVGSCLSCHGGSQ